MLYFVYIRGANVKTKIIKIILIMSLFFNIAHDAVIALSEQHVNESISEYILEQQQGSECGNAGESHHLFHFCAIHTESPFNLQRLLQSSMIVSETSTFEYFLRDKQIKPPIA